MAAHGCKLCSSRARASPQRRIAAAASSGRVATAHPSAGRRAPMRDHRHVRAEESIALLGIDERSATDARGPSAQLQLSTWRKRKGIEPSKPSLARGFIGFEDRGRHQSGTRFRYRR
jgi:hypothetical protein